VVVFAVEVILVVGFILPDCWLLLIDERILAVDYGLFGLFVYPLSLVKIEANVRFGLTG